MGDVGARLDPERDRHIVLYCAHGNRSLRLAKAMHAHGFEDVVSLAGGITAWAEAGLPVEIPGGLDEAQRIRYSRHVLIPEIGVAGQERLLAANVLVVGAGGLGSPAALYLAAAGIGRLGIVDDDLVDESNLQRQVLHSTAALGEPKVASAERTVRELNPDVEVVPYRERLGADNVDGILDEGWEVIVDGADNFPTRYLLNDASVLARHPRRPRLDLPLRGPGHRLRPGRRPLLPLPLPAAASAGARAELRRGRRAGCAPGGDRLDPGRGDAQARARDRRAARRAPAAVRRAGRIVRRGLGPARPRAAPSAATRPTITEYVDYVEFCAGPG